MKALIILCLCAGFLGLAVETDAALHRCAVCKQLIESDKFVQAGDKYFHPNHFTCADCNKPIRVSRYYERDGQLYDSTCYLERYGSRCHYCGELIAGDYALVSGRKYHDSCYTESVALKCALCNRLLEGPYLEDFFGHKVHKSHKGVISQCEYCGRFISQEISGGSTILADGREVCGICNLSMVDSEREADSIMQAVKDIMAELGLAVNPRYLELRTMSRSEMLAMQPPRGANAQAFTRHEHYSRLWGLLTKDKFKIYVLRDLPTIEYVATIAHELMHVWLGLNGPVNIDETLAEGSCNYAAVLVLTRFGSDSRYLLDKLIKDPDPVYGDGLRHVHDFVQASGFAAWRDYLKKNSTPPWHSTEQATR